MKTSKLFLFFAALSGLLAVIIGAFGAHVLEKSLNAQLLQRLHTGVEYQFYHTAALLAVGILCSLHRNYASISLKLSGFSFMLGILLFCGSLYAYAFTGETKFGMVTPFGGAGFMLGWLFLLGFALRRKQHSE